MSRNICAGRLRAFVILVVMVMMIGAVPQTLATSRIPLTLTFWGEGKDLPVYENLVAPFVKAHPDIDLKVVNIPSLGGTQSYVTKVLTMIAGGTPPDVLQIDAPDFVAMAGRNAFYNLDTFLTKEPEVKADIYPQLLSAFQADGHQYALPKDFTTVVVYYNEDMFRDAGLKMPNEYAREGQWTWDTLLKVAKALTKDVDGDGKVDQFGVAPETWGGFWNFWVWQAGGREFNDAITESTINSPQAREGLQFLSDLWNKYHVAPTPAQKTSMQAYQMFQNGKVGMVMYGRWMVATYRQVKSFRWDIAPLPAGKEKATPIFSSGWAIARNAKHPDKAWELLRYLCGAEGQRAIAELGVGVPVSKTIAESDMFIQPGMPPKHASVFMESLEFGRFLPFFEQYGKADSITNKELDRLWIGQSSAEEVTNAIKNQVDAILKR
ncbi:MAG: sugar ABC transporter substrate-binding protein [Bacillota bacterium]|nr:sugar ABC transporter substrate-binding protein [Bacillota bacterium]